MKTNPNITEAIEDSR